MKVLNTKSNRTTNTFSYVILEKSPENENLDYDARVLDVIKEKNTVKLNLCVADGTLQQTTSTRDEHDDYKTIKKLYPGDIRNKLK